MAEAGDGSGPSGRGSGGVTRGGNPKAMFKPVVPTRRIKQEDTATAAQPSSAAGDSQKFAALVDRARSLDHGASRGRGGHGFRGRGRRANADGAVVTFGSDVSFPTRGRPSGSSGASGRAGGSSGPSGRGGGGGGGGGGGRGGGGGGNKGSSSGGGGGGGGGVRVKQEPSAGAVHAHVLSQEALGGVEGVLDFNSYYPTCLPLRTRDPTSVVAEMDEGVYEPTGEELEEAVAAKASPIPAELAASGDARFNTARDLGLAPGQQEEETNDLLLLQLPQQLPLHAVRAPVKLEHGAAANDRRAVGGVRGDAAVATGDAAAAAGGIAAAAPAAASFEELPTGYLGKLLVFESGRVKLQVGDVLLDVSSGIPILARQDVAAIDMNTMTDVILGHVERRATVGPDVWQLLSDAPPPAFQRAPGVVPAETADALLAAAAATAAEAAHSNENAMEVDGEEALSARVAAARTAAAAAALRKAKGKAAARAAAADADHMEID